MLTVSPAAARNEKVSLCPTLPRLPASVCPQETEVAQLEVASETTARFRSYEPVLVPLWSKIRMV